MPEKASLEDVLLDSAQIKCLLQAVVSEWQALPDKWRPWGVWIALRAPLPASTDIIGASKHSVHAAWFLENGIPQPRSIWEYIRWIP